MIVFFILTLLFAGFLSYAAMHGYRLWQDERAHKRATEQWKERQRVRARMRLIKGGKGKEPDPDDRT
jgi:hypothetical protein